MLPGLNPISLITVAGTYVVTPDVTLIEVNCAGAIIITLPTALYPKVPAVSQPALYAKKPITIVDIGGNASAHPITIQPASGAENVLGLTSIQITANYGGITLNPSNTQKGWTNPQ